MLPKRKKGGLFFLGSSKPKGARSHLQGLNGCLVLAVLQGRAPAPTSRGIANPSQWGLNRDPHSYLTTAVHGIAPKLIAQTMLMCLNPSTPFVGSTSLRTFANISGHLVSCRTCAPIQELRRAMTDKQGRGPKTYERGAAYLWGLVFIAIGLATLVGSW